MNRALRDAAWARPLWCGKESCLSAALLFLAACGPGESGPIEVGPVPGPGFCASFQIDFFRASSGCVRAGESIDLTLAVSWDGSGPRGIEFLAAGSPMGPGIFQKEATSNTSFTLTGTVKVAETTGYTAHAFGSACLSGGAIAELTVRAR